MHQVSLQKIDEIIGADAVLYIAIERWGAVYQIFNSRVAVTITCRLVDVKSGLTLWAGEQSVVSDSGVHAGGENALATMLVAALVSQIVSSITDPSHALAIRANRTLLHNRRRGMLPGPYHPEHEAELMRHQAKMTEAGL